MKCFSRVETQYVFIILLRSHHFSVSLHNSSCILRSPLTPCLELGVRVSRLSPSTPVSGLIPAPLPSQTQLEFCQFSTSPATRSLQQHVLLIGMHHIQPSRSGSKLFQKIFRLKLSSAFFLIMNSVFLSVTFPPA
ncbi:hypothetical protein ILYODFUR_037574 [Ilyodon furcidens]|uniref:Uncharacterized protein n=1 Tax=Ilyodon furcidens TaxID=33524 RepID=A0ABV0VB60_9TELE